MTRPVRRLLIRADAGHRIGSGHVMRCLTIADSLREAGVSVRFACKDHLGHMAGIVRARGYACDLLPVTAGWQGTGYSAWLGGSVEDDAHRTAALLRETGGADALLVDHYGLDAAYHHALRDTVRRIAVFEDLPDRHHDCDLVIDQNIGHAPSLYAGRVPAGATLLVGPDHAVIPAAFGVLRPQALERRSRVETPKRLLVAVGGTDPDDLTGRVLTALRPPALFERVDVVLSSSAQHLEGVRTRIATMDDTTMHVDTREMPALMASADLAIGAAGVTALERCVVGLPSLVIPMADNQLPAITYLTRAGAARHLEGIEEATPSRIRDALVELAGRPDALRAMSAAAAGLCDGGGLARVVPAFLDIF